MDLDRSPRLLSSRRRGIVVALAVLSWVLPGRGSAQTLDEWVLLDLGGPPASRVIDAADGCITIETPRSEGDASPDAGSFIHHELTGDGAVEAQFHDLHRGGAGSLRVAVELRHAAIPASPLVGCAASRSGPWTTRLVYRDLQDTALEEEPLAPLEIPEPLFPPDMYLRLERRGDTVTALISPDRWRWLVLGEHRLAPPVPATLLAGVFLHTGGSPVVATLCNLRLDGPEDLLPVVDWEPEPAPAFVGDEVLFEALAETPAAALDIVKYTWTFDDGTDEANGRSITHRFLGPGDFPVLLTTEDAAGRTLRRRNTAYLLYQPQTHEEWRRVDLFGVGPGEVAKVDGCLAMTGRASPFLDRSDLATFLHQEVRGDVVITTRIAAASVSPGSPAFGLMVRESLDHRSRHAHLTARHDGERFVPQLLARTAWRRDETLVGSAPGGMLPPQPPGLWLRLVRQGASLAGYASGDAVSWSELGRLTLDPPPAESLLVGLSVTATCGGGFDCETPFTATFCETTLEGEVPVQTPRFRRGDVDASGRLSITDAIIVYHFLFKGGAGPACEDSADTNDDGVLDLSDVAVIVGYLFRGASEPASPGPLECGEDADASDALLSCEEGCR